MVKDHHFSHGKKHGVLVFFFLGGGVKVRVLRKIMALGLLFLGLKWFKKKLNDVVLILQGVCLILCMIRFNIARGTI